MIRLAMPLMLAAGPALAHGGHPDVPSAWHGAAHLAVGGTIALAIAVLAAVMLRQKRRGRD